ncbi:MAG: hypothetical protein MRJ52_13835, partial [Nitrosomonas sp.]|nr:hypothetical protein [Nitrosomonas sp.]
IFDAFFGIIAHFLRTHIITADRTAFALINTEKHMILIITHSATAAVRIKKLLYVAGQHLAKSSGNTF